MVLPCELFSRGMQFAPIYIFGVLASVFGLQGKEKLFKEPLLSLALLCFIVCSMSYCHVDISYLNKAFKLLASFSVCYIALYYISSGSVKTEGKVVEVLCYIGKNSIVIYLTHFFFNDVFPTPQFNTQIQPFWVFVMSLLLTVFIVVACLFIGLVCDRFKWVNRIAYGRGW